MRCGMHTYRTLTRQGRMNLEKPSTSRAGTSMVDRIVSSHETALNVFEMELVKADDERIKRLRNTPNRLLREVSRLQQAALSPRCRFVITGSSVTGLGDTDSDVDLIIFLLNAKERETFCDAFYSSNTGIQEVFLSALRSVVVHYFSNVNGNSGGDGKGGPSVEYCYVYGNTRIPILHCKLVSGEVLDICVTTYEYQAIRNTALIRNYVQCDPRFGRMCTWLKMWSKAMGIKESKGGLMSSYYLVLLAIHFLQSPESLGTFPVLPTLCISHPHLVDSRLPVDDIVRQLDAPPPKELTDWKSRNTMTTAELIVRFMGYYSKLNFFQTGIFIERGVTRQIKMVGRRGSNLVDPYSKITVCRSPFALRAFEDAVNYTLRRMQNGGFINSFPSFPDADRFVSQTQHSEWRLLAEKMRKSLKARRVP